MSRYLPEVAFVGALAVGLAYLLAPRPEAPETARPEADLHRAKVAAYFGATQSTREPVSTEADPLPPVTGLRRQEDAAVPDHQEVVDLRARVRDLETALASPDSLRFYLRQAEERAALEPDGQIGAWAAALPPGSVPDERTRLTMASLLHDYPVELQPDEGLWLVERIQLGDWYLWGPSADEAIIAFLGAGRIAQDCTPAQLAHLKEEWGAIQWP